jgi:hypothetical protein
MAAVMKSLRSKWDCATVGRRPKIELLAPVNSGCTNPSDCWNQRDSVSTGNQSCTTTGGVQCVVARKPWNKQVLESGGERGITRRYAPRPFGAALRVLTKPTTQAFHHLGTNHNASPNTYPTGVIPFRRFSSPGTPAAEGFLMPIYGGERGIRTLEGLLTLTPLAGVRLRPLGHLSASQ